VMQWAFKSIAPRVRRSVPVAVPRQKIFIVILRADGLDDFELPVSTLTMRMRSVKASYVRVTVSDPLEKTDNILPRMGGRMIIFAGEKTADGERHLEELMYANIQNIYYSEARTSSILTLTGTRFITYSSPVAQTPEKISRVSCDDQGRYAVQTTMDWLVRPGDTINTDMGSFAAELVIHTVLYNNAHTTIEGYDGQS
jgi:hypothetical protein